MTTVATGQERSRLKASDRCKNWKDAYLTVGSCVGGLVNVINEIAQFLKLISTVFPETLVDADEIIGSR